MVLHLIAWVVVAYVTMSATEYVSHRWFMHRPIAARWPALTQFPRLQWLWGIVRHAYARHAVLHHGRHYGRSFERSDDPEAQHTSVDVTPAEMLVGLAPLWLPVFFFVSWTGGVILAMTFVAHGFAWGVLHREMHEPQGRWFATTRLYRFFRGYHAAHHAHVNRNFNAIFPLFDHLFGTYGGRTVA